MQIYPKSLLAAPPHTILKGPNYIIQSYVVTKIFYVSFSPLVFLTVNIKDDVYSVGPWVGYGLQYIYHSDGSRCQVYVIYYARSCSSQRRNVLIKKN